MAWYMPSFVMSEDVQRFTAVVSDAAVTVLLSLLVLVAPAVARAERCAWRPFTDVTTAQQLLQQWAADTGLPAFDKEKSGLGVDRDSARLTLQFTAGSLTIAWTLDEKCEPTAIKIESSADYVGVHPEEHAVERLVAALRAVAPEQRAGSSIVSRVVQTLAALTAALLLLFWRRIPRAATLRGLPPRAVAWLRGISTPNRIRLLGVVAIVALLPYRSPPSEWGSTAGAWVYANVLPLMVVLPLIVFLWLVVSGVFGYGTARREDWPALLAFLFALAIREGYACHGVEGDVLHFMGKGGFDSHSILYTFYLMFVHPLARDPFQLQMHSNGVLGAVAALPLYLFIRQRTGSRRTAVVVAVFYAVHPILARMAPTDSPYALCFATWFMGLALLSNAEIGPRQLIGGGTLLGIAAICRPDGGLFLAASLFLLDVPALLRAVRRHLGVAVFSASVIVAMLAAEVHFVFSTHMGSSHALPVDEFSVAATFWAWLWSTDYNDLVLVILVLVGGVAGLVNKRLRVGLGAVVGVLIVVWPFCGTTTGGYIILHRLSPACALQSIAAGIGASWLTTWLPAKLRQHWASVLPAVMAAVYLLVVHRHEIHDQNGLSDEFWMLRNHLAPAGVVKEECKLVWVGRSMDTDLHNFEDVVPGMEGIRCQERDCLAEVAKGGCFYYMRGLNCFFSEAPTKPECLHRGKTAAGGYMACIDPECVRVETSLQLELVEQRTVDVHSIWNYEHGNPPDPHFPIEADVALYRVIGLKR